MTSPWRRRWPEPPRPHQPRRRRTSPCWGASVRLSDAPGGRLPEGGGAAAYRPPERQRRRAGAAATSEDGGVDPGELAPFWHAAVGEEGEAATAEHAASADLSGEQRDSGGARRRRRRRAAACGREKGGSRSAGDFARRTSKFPGIAPRSLYAGKRVLRVLFTGLGGAFLQIDHGRIRGPSDRRQTARIEALLFTVHHCRRTVPRARRARQSARL